MNDLALRDQVQEELEFEPSLDAADIGVAVENGVVTLSGHVRSFSEKLAAERAVQRVRGVRAIAGQLSVRFPEDKKTADDEIAARAVRILDWDTAIPKGKVTVKVQKGWVTLSGEVEWQFQRTGAEKAIRRLSGVTGISNKIIVRPHIEPGDVLTRIERALRRNAEIDFNGIAVQVNGTRVTLSGTVPSWRSRRTAERTAWSVPGVTAVEDDLMVA